MHQNENGTQPMPQQSGWSLPNEICAFDTESKPLSLCTHSYFGLPPSQLGRSFESLSTIKTRCRTSKKHLEIYCQVYMFLLSPSDTIYLYRIMCFSIDRQRLQPPLLGIGELSSKLTWQSPLFTWSTFHSLNFSKSFLNRDFSTEHDNQELPQCQQTSHRVGKPTFGLCSIKTNSNIYNFTSC